MPDGIISPRKADKVKERREKEENEKEGKKFKQGKKEKKHQSSNPEGKRSKAQGVHPRKVRKRKEKQNTLRPTPREVMPETEGPRRSLSDTDLTMPINLVYPSSFLGTHSLLLIWFLSVRMRKLLQSLKS